MSKAFLWLIDGTHKTIEPEQGVTIWQLLNGHGEPTEEQAKFLPNVRDVFIPPSFQDQATGYKAAHKLTPDTSHLTHVGIEQGKTQMLPTGDRD